MYSTLDSFVISMWYPLRQISLKLSNFLLNLLEYNALLIYNSVPPGNMMLALSELSIKFTVPDIVFTLVLLKLSL